MSSKGIKGQYWSMNNYGKVVDEMSAVGWNDGYTFKEQILIMVEVRI